MDDSPVHPQNPVHAATPTSGRPTGLPSQLPQNNPSHPSLPQPQYHKEKNMRKILLQATEAHIPRDKVPNYQPGLTAETRYLSKERDATR